MWIYQKTLEHPVNLKSKDLKMAKFLITQFGGPNGELAAAVRYLSQRFTMPTGKSKALLTDIGTEELAHVEMIASMVYQLTKDATPEELRKAGLGENYAQNGFGIFPSDAHGVPFSTCAIAVMGNPVTDLHEDMAAEQKALATYYQLVNLTDDVDIKNVLRFLGEREIIHYQRFGEALMDVYDYQKQKQMF
ncbi:manganese catalase family protein [Paraclostridium sordellii]|uniref:manganese catalase family protein n=1 Tax=Paraclostridium sordellii TaxID=1505 RepID=UPI000386A378|nr:manganese catalase family protein [Paeniclostridium sordellii]EPZ58269.1 manganese containing catalase family protein [[Clostridium] sordellii VPI 9048] [Paeniclostridium sordellii VPI 9048]CEK37171.1 Spore coat peptide assembly protein CotJC 2 [[Clostridium] sordellii] [Paeniclostridium sordellii]